MLDWHCRTDDRSLATSRRSLGWWPAWRSSSSPHWLRSPLALMIRPTFRSAYCSQPSFPSCWSSPCSPDPAREVTNCERDCSSTVPPDGWHRHRLKAPRCGLTSRSCRQHQKATAMSEDGGETHGAPLASTLSSRGLAELAKAGYVVLDQPYMQVDFEVHHLTDHAGYLYQLLSAGPPAERP